MEAVSKCHESERILRETFVLLFFSLALKDVTADREEKRNPAKRPIVRLF